MFVCYVVLSVLCSLVITFWESTGLLALLFVLFSYVFVTFPYGVPGQVWYLIVSIPGLCLILYFNIFCIPLPTSLLPIDSAVYQKASENDHGY